MSAMRIVTRYDEIPAEARALLDILYTSIGAEIWWNSRNRLLGGKRPHEVSLPDAMNLLHALTGGVS